MSKRIALFSDDLLSFRSRLLFSWTSGCGSGVAMSGSAFTFTGSVSSDWNTASNWNLGTVPGVNDLAIINGGPTPAVISGGASVEVGGLQIQNGSDLFVGGSAMFGGSGLGYLTVPNIVNVGFGGVLAATQGSTITAADIIAAASAGATAGVIGGGGTFDVRSFGQPFPPQPGVIEGNILADGGDDGLGPLTIDAAVVDLGTIEIRGGSTLELNAPSGDTLDVTPSQNGVSGPGVFLFDQNFFGSIALVGGTSLDLYLPAGVEVSSAVVSGATLDIAFSNGPPNTDAIGLLGTGYSATLLQTGSGGSTRPEIELSPVCYRRGTRIAVPEGYRTIEQLQPGDLVVTARGEHRRITWIGHRRIDCRRHPMPGKVWPVRVMAGAFGPGLPARDLYLSPQHSIYAEGVLIPVKVLVNGDTVKQVRVLEIEYFHVELDCHEILRAEGLPAESYLDTGDRGMFDNAAGTATALFPDFARWAWDARACAELKVVGPEVAAVRKRLACRPLRQAAAPARAFRRRAG